METKEIIRKIILEHEEKDGILTKSLAVLSHRPFNMKGQEIEEIVGLILLEGLKNTFKIEEPVVKVPQNKKSADIEFKFDGEDKSLEIKSYGGAERFQLSTLKNVLQEIRNKFNGTEARFLSDNEKEWLIQKIKLVEIEYNLTFLSFIRSESKVDVQIFDFENLNLEIFKDLEFNLKIIGKEKRVQIYIKITKNSTLEISSGGNPLNRGMWINKIKRPADMNLVFETGFITKIHEREIVLKDFDKNKYIFEKEKRTIELIKEQF
jgi:hypothetical protein